MTQCLRNLHVSLFLSKNFYTKRNSRLPITTSHQGFGVSCLSVLFIHGTCTSLSLPRRLSCETPISFGKACLVRKGQHGNILLPCLYRHFSSSSSFLKSYSLPFLKAQREPTVMIPWTRNASASRQSSIEIIPWPQLFKSSNI